MKINPSVVQKELQDKFPQVEEFFLYGSISKARQIYFPELRAPLVEPSFDVNTDYDFAVRYTPEVEQMFVASDWTWKDQLDYQDCCTERVFEKEVLGEKIQISLRSKYNSFKAAWLSIPDNIYWSILNKRSPHYIGPHLVREYIDSLVWLHEGVYGKFDVRRYL